ncbi:MAG: hypothetical protein M1818_004901 [Claussenomyces sp. TS43310]|nr:MAG: hypothetical protein M1818_004901 [Claussenomyces sp. TS43310]
MVHAPFPALAAACLLPFALAAPAADKRDASPTVSLPHVTLVGSVASNVASFKGIPFAQPPIGGLRLKPPQAITATLGTLQATGTPRACPQFSAQADTSSLPNNVISELLDSKVIQAIENDGEDCLTLNVDAPSNATSSSKLPVLLWLYGGGFESGSTQLYDGTSLITAASPQGKDFIFVAANYRVGGFGFLPGSAVLKDGSANIGLLDQRLALQWIADNIEAFGGDPDKVTIFGESAGAMSAFLQMALYSGDNTYNGKPLFRGAIMDSGSLTPTEPIDSARAELVYNQVVENAGCAGVEDALECLRSLDYQTYLKAANSVPALFGYTGNALSYIPRPDGTVLAASPDVVAKEGKFAKVPFILGDQEDEGTLFALSQTNLTTTEDVVEYFSSVYFQSATKEQVKAFVDLYPEDPSAGAPFGTGLLNNIYPQFKRVAAIIGDTTFILLRRNFLQYASDVPSWTFISSYLNDLPILGTFHGSDVLEVFFLTSGSPATSAHDYYFNFIYNLDPNNGTAGLINWPRWSESQQALQFGLTGNKLIADDFRSEASEFISANTEVFYL